MQKIIQDPMDEIVLAFGETKLTCNISNTHIFYCAVLPFLVCWPFNKIVLFFQFHRTMAMLSRANQP